MTQDQYRGCMLGLALGDALGAPHEGGFLEHGLWRLIGRTAAGEPRWTDDTQMTLDLAESLLATMPLDQTGLAQRFAHSYRWRRGYGPGAARVLKRIRKGQDWQSAARAVYPQGSFGNGAAMRAPVLALFFADDVTLLAAAHASAEVTHGHPLAIAGAQLIAIATKGLLQRQSFGQVLDALDHLNLPDEFTRRLQLARQWLEANSQPGAVEVVRSLGNGMTATTSCVTALYIALRHLECGFDEMMTFVIKCGGDVDTIAAMAGAMWGTRNGVQALPQLRIEARDEIDQLAQRIFARMHDRP